VITSLVMYLTSRSDMKTATQDTPFLKVELKDLLVPLDRWKDPKHKPNDHQTDLVKLEKYKDVFVAGFTRDVWIEAGTSRSRGDNQQHTGQDLHEPRVGFGLLLMVAAIGKHSY